jgi:hypothetical protein
MPSLRQSLILTAAAGVLLASVCGPFGAGVAHAEFWFLVLLAAITGLAVTSGRVLILWNRRPAAQGGPTTGRWVLISLAGLVLAVVGMAIGADAALFVESGNPRPRVIRMLQTATGGWLFWQGLLVAIGAALLAFVPRDSDFTSLRGPDRDGNGRQV